MEKQAIQYAQKHPFGIAMRPRFMSAYTSYGLYVDEGGNEPLKLIVEYQRLPTDEELAEDLNDDAGHHGFFEDREAILNGEDVEVGHFEDSYRILQVVK